ncbi:MAG: DUF6691 family protein [Gammaproteobacteria bacterium]|nr:YeeE/YedE family protein [Xanthomonadales bacterium]MCB1595586.1 YeeE/YedE family protein [Xanthomonadales bacterium]MCB1603670.1 YeeE/YedE family protein [Xanthomonadales bacterium]
MKEIILAIVIGGAFGFILHKVGATNPNKIVGFLRLTDLHLAKVILFAIGFSSLLLFILMAAGVIPTSHISVKSSYVGVIVGGAIFGIGFGLGGYCPGTTLAALGAGRKDSIFMILGGLVGAWVYVLLYGWLTENMSWLFDKIGGGAVSLAQTGNEKYPALIDGVSGLVVAGVIAILFMGGAALLPNKLRK